MRRSERSITDRTAIDAIIRASRVCRLGMVDGGEPYVVPLSFGYDGAALYFHSAPEGRKLDCLRRDGRVCFEFDLPGQLIEAEVACRWGIAYRSVIGTGRAEILTDPAAQRAALACIMAQYAPGRDPASFIFDDSVLARTVVIQVRIETISGKQSA